MRCVLLLFLLGCSESLIAQIGGPDSPQPSTNIPNSALDELPKTEPFDLPIEDCDTVTIETVDQVRPVDIIWAVDTSPSMSGEKNMVRSRLNTFSSQLDVAGIDAHVVLIATSSSDGGICVNAPLGSGSCPSDHNPPQLFRDYQWVGSHNALGRMIGQWDNYKTVIRDNSVKYYAVVTDDNTEWTAKQFTDSRNSLDPDGADRWTFFGMFCEHRDKGDVYQTLVDQTGGMHVELCTSNPDWTAVFDEMEQTVMENRSLDCQLDIPDAPIGYSFEEDKINVDYIPGDGSPSQRFYRVASAADCGASGGWHYDDPTNPTRIELCEASCSAVDGDFKGELDIWFGCTSMTQP